MTVTDGACGIGVLFGHESVLAMDFVLGSNGAEVEDDDSPFVLYNALRDTELARQGWSAGEGSLEDMPFVDDTPVVVLDAFTGVVKAGGGALCRLEEEQTLIVILDDTATCLASISFLASATRGDREDNWPTRDARNERKERNEVEYHRTALCLLPLSLR